MRARRVTAPVIAFVVSGWACSEPSRPERRDDSSPDAGPPAEVPSALALAAPARTFASPGETVSIDVEIVRTGFDDPVTIDVTGLRDGITCAPVEISRAETSASLSCAVAAATPQGYFGEQPTLRARSVTRNLVSSVRLEGLVRGTPGELDATFGDGGVVVIEDTRFVFGHLVLGPRGSIYFAGSTTNPAVQRLTSEGVLDAAFGAVSLGYTSLTGLAWNGTHVYLAGEEPQLTGKPDWLVRRVDGDGAPDMAYAGTGWFRRGGGDSPPSLGDFLGLLVDDTGAATLYGRAGIVHVTSDGQPATIPLTRIDSADVLTAAVSSPGRIVGIAGHSVIGVSTATNALDETFGTNGVRSLGTQLTALVRDENGRYVVAGHDYLARDAMVARLTEDGAVDDSFAFTGAISYAPPASAPLVAVTGSAVTVVRYETPSPEYTECIVERFLESGSLDAKFGANGVVKLPGPQCVPSHVVALPDGRILVAARDRLFRMW